MARPNVPITSLILTAIMLGHAVLCGAIEPLAGDRQSHQLHRPIPVIDVAQIEYQGSTAIPVITVAAVEYRGADMIPLITVGTITYKGAETSTLPAIVPAAAAIFGGSGGSATFTVKDGSPPYTILVDDGAFPPQPAQLTESGQTFSISIPAGTAAQTVTIMATDAENHSTTATLAVAVQHTGKTRISREIARYQPKLLGSGRVFNTDRPIQVTAARKPDKPPVIECLQRGRWTGHCPSPVSVRYIGGGERARYLVRAEAGTYRVRIGGEISEPFEVMQRAPAADKRTVTAATASPAARPDKAPEKIHRKKQPAAAPPAVTLNRQRYTGGARIRPEVKAPAGASLRYRLEREEQGRYRTIEESDTADFLVQQPGNYRVQARYDGGAWGPPRAFTVIPRRQATPQAAERSTAPTELPQRKAFRRLMRE